MVEPLRRVVVRRPDKSFGDADPVRWHYVSQPGLRRAQQEHAVLSELLRASGVQVIYHDVPLDDRADAIYVFDPVLVTDHGAITLRMGKELRRGEEAALATTLRTAGVPLLAELEAPALAEGGDLLWLDKQTLAVGLGFRTNQEGFRQLANILQPLGVTLVPVELPYHQGPQACLHLLSLISLLDHRLAAVFPPLLPASFWQLLKQRDFKLIRVPESEFATMGTNILALGPRRCLMLEGNPVTRCRIEADGCQVLTYRGREISLKAEGGPTCLTCPLLRA